MVQTRSRRKSTASGAATGADSEWAPSTTGRGTSAPVAAAGREVDYAELYRQAARRQKEEERSNFLLRWRRRIHLLYHQQAMIWGWYMLEPWETALWMSLLLLLAYAVLSACFVNPSSACRQSLVAARNSLAARGAKLLALARPVNGGS